jgi:hypothetical protein
MKKLLLLALLATMMVGCKDEEGREYATDERGYTYGVTVIDSCEYYHGTYMLTHKGNCRFCAERNKKMIKEQIDTVLIEIFD